MNLRPQRAIFAGDVGFYDEDTGVFRSWRPPQRGSPPASVLHDLDGQCIAIEKFSDLSGQPTSFTWGDIWRTQETRRRLPTGEVETEQTFFFQGGEALLLRGMNERVERLVRSTTPRRQLDLWLETNPALMVVEQCVRFSPCFLALKRNATAEAHSVILQTRIDANGRTTLLRCTGQSDTVAVVQHYAPDDYLVPWIRVVPLANFIGF